MECGKERRGEKGRGRGAVGKTESKASMAPPKLVPSIAVRFLDEFVR